MATQTHTLPRRAEAISQCETTLLGNTYPGRPIGLALRMRNHEQDGRSDEAHAILDAHNRIRLAFGQQPYDLAADFTDLPMEGGFTIQAVRREVLTGMALASAAVAVPVTAIAKAQPDSRAWDKAFSAWRVVQGKFDALCNRFNAAEEAWGDADPRVMAVFR
jgi:hypothetical protein